MITIVRWTINWICAAKVLGDEPYLAQAMAHSYHTTTVAIGGEGVTRPPQITLVFYDAK